MITIGIINLDNSNSCLDSVRSGEVAFSSSSLQCKTKSKNRALFNSKNMEDPCSVTVPCKFHRKS